MALNVDPQELVSAAAALSALAQEVHAALPAGWVHPAGGDTHSALATSHYNAQAESAINNVIAVLNGLAPHAQQIGAAAADYTRADEAGGRQMGGGGSEIIANPVAAQVPFETRQAPIAPLAAGPPSIDPLTFAQQLHSGPGPAPARAFADSVRQFLGGAHAAAQDGLQNAVPVMNNWTPVGTTVASHLNDYQNQLSQIGDGLDGIASGVDAYADAFQTAKSRHPTPQEITATRQRLLAAMRSNSPALAAALAEFNDQTALSGQTHAAYTAAVNSTTATNGLGSGSPAAGNTNATSASQTPGTSQNSDSSMLTQLLPSLMNALNGSKNALSPQGSPQHDPTIPTGGPSEDPYTNLPTMPSFPDGGSPTVPSGEPSIPADLTSTVYPVDQLPVVTASTALGSSGLPRAPVIEPLQTSAAAAAANRGTGGSSMPYMPMMPGMNNGGGGNDRSRIVAWHPDRLMYVDDTPYTDVVIGEKPTIAPIATPPTPAPANQAPTNTGGSV
ncbi:PPE domain-containing protein [Nocardia sp. NBC_01327]|uniref:PPE domain-containing protein n=1 Tax=Nocardia sp. NBC_01327 TaxID=2903593 RepID=UPI002E0E0C26|nr:PPE domain-containing protein [Nocardia sp. NBC_01327]